MENLPRADAAAWESFRLIARLLRPGDEPALQKVFEAAGDYFLRIIGRPAPEPDAAEREIRACAATPGREVALLSLIENGEAVGALGWWRGNPEPEVALLGILLIVPEHRGQGLAREAVAGLEGRLGGEGIGRLRTAVAAGDFPTHALLRALGFVQMSIRDHAALGLAGADLALFEKPLA